MEYIKNDGENSILKLTYKNCKYLDGKCFIDLDKPNYLEVIKFIITEDEIQCRYTGTNCIKGYDFVTKDKYGIYSSKDVCNGDTLMMIHDNNELIKEIPEELYQKLFNEIIFRIVFNEENQEKWQNIANNYIKQIKL